MTTTTTTARAAGRGATTMRTMTARPGPAGRATTRETARVAAGRETDDNEDLPPPRKKKSSGVGLVLGILGGVLLLCCGGGGLVVYLLSDRIGLDVRDRKVSNNNLKQIGLASTTTTTRRALPGRQSRTGRQAAAELAGATSCRTSSRTPCTSSSSWTSRGTGPTTAGWSARCPGCTPRRTRGPRAGEGKTVLPRVRPQGGGVREAGVRSRATD